MTKKIERLFIANRGEILRRIALTAKNMDLRTYSVWQDEEQPPSVLTEVVDEFVTVHSEQNAYLNQDLLIKIATDLQCDAVHPGFGFLSENAGFAQACIDAGLIWVGPHPKSMEAMASKDTSRKIAKESGVPVNVALEGVDPNDAGSTALVEDFAKQTGFPLLVKAALGGGGKGMRLVNSLAELPEAIKRGHSEAVSSFGDGTLLLERYITSPRHVEVQVFGDKTGNVYALGDRDCSLQRRHQKIVEEAPSPHLSEQMRQQMHSAAVALAKSVHYDSAGTVEFLVDTAEDGGARFYFLEMNTRLQVEHPVTEEIFGLDLVAWQLRVAAGEELPDWSQLTPRGWAVEARIYAEDCESNFLPSPGPIFDFRPSSAPGIRWETGIDRCDRVYEKYDPMIAKAVAFAPTRAEALQKLACALRRTPLFGITSNVGYLITLLEDPEFIKGGVSTHYLKDEAEAIQASWDKRRTKAEKVVKQIRSALQSVLHGQAKPAEPGTAVAKHRSSVFQNHLEKSTRAVFRHIETYSAHSGTVQAGKIYVDSNEVYFCIFTRLNKTERWFTVDGVIFKDALEESTLDQFMSTDGSEGDLTAPVPGKVMAVCTEAGQSVRPGDVLLVLESMKLEFEVKADREAMVAQIHVTPGTQVGAGDTLVSWDVN